MSKHTKDFEGELRRLGNRPKHSFGQKQRRRNLAQDFCHLVKRFPGQAAQSEDAMKFIANRFGNPSDVPSAYEAIKYLVEDQFIW